MVRLYMDENVNGAITRELRKRGVDALTVQEDGYAGTPDPQVLDRATALERVLFTHDDDLIAEAVQRLQSGRAFVGVIYAHKLRVALGKCIADLEYLALVGELKDFADKMYYLPL